MLVYSLLVVKHTTGRKAMLAKNLNLDILQLQVLTYKMHLISYPGQLCLVRPG